MTSHRPLDPHPVPDPGPESTSDLVVRGVALRLVRPSDPDRLLDDPSVQARNREDDYMPYWAYLWPGAYLLAEAVARESWRAGTAALEIGCGLGLAGLVGLARGLRVTFSDYDAAPLGFVARSAAASGFDPAAYSTRLLDWRAPPDERFGVVLAADVLYERRLVPLVADLLAAMLAPGGLALVAGPYRVASVGFAAAVAARGLSCRSEPVSADGGALGAVRGTLHRVGFPAQLTPRGLPR
jgi:predicted nicotinamide N-methyase